MTQIQAAASLRERLEQAFAKRRPQGVLVAMSGGVDSSTLAALAHEVLGDQMLAVTVDAESSAEVEVRSALRTAREASFPHRVVEHSELSDPAYVANTPARCYHCREGIVERLSMIAREEGLGCVAMGYLPEDAQGHAPGRIAAEASGAWFPYVEVGADKQAVRSLADELGLETADRPGNACLSSRIPYGRAVTEEKLRRIEAAEQAIRELAGVDQVRVRHHGEVARIEVLPENQAAVLGVAGPVTTRLKELGFTWVSMDLLGYRSGALNEAFEDPPPEHPDNV